MLRHKFVFNSALLLVWTQNARVF